jgi:hypothetical protein
MLPRRQPVASAGSEEPQPRPAVRPPEGYTPPAPVASEPPVESWFTTTVPLRDPEELLNTYLTGRAEGVGGAIRNPLGAIAKRGSLSPRGPVPAATPEAPGAVRPGDPAAPAQQPPLTASGLPTRVPQANLPQPTQFDPFGTPPAAPTPAPALPAEPLEEQPATAGAVVEEPAAPAGPVLDPLIAELAADVLSAPSAAEALSALAEDEEDDDTSIFATLQSEWFTRRTPLEARRTQADAAEEAERDGADWVSPGDEGWRRAAEVAAPAAVEAGAPLTADGLPKRVPGRNLVPGSAAPAAASAAPAPENVVALPRPERRRTRGLSSFQQGVSRARTGESATESPSEEITVPGAYDAAEDRAHEEHQ